MHHLGWLVHESRWLTRWVLAYLGLVLVGIALLLVMVGVLGLVVRGWVHLWAYWLALLVAVGLLHPSKVHICMLLICLVILLITLPG